MSDEQQQHYAMGFVVPIPRFSGRREDFSTFTERFHSCMEANQISDPKRRTHILISSMGDDLYKLAHNLIAPTKVADAEYEEIVKKLSAHLNPPPGIITARCIFNRSLQRSDEDINTFAARLKREAEDCQYDSYLSMWLRDRFVAALHNEAIRRRLLQEQSDLTFEKAHKIALTYETATREARTLQPAQSSKGVNWVQKQSKQKSQTKPFNKPKNYKSQNQKGKQNKCMRCTSPNHVAPDCPLKNATCVLCHKKGHLDIACLSSKNSTQKFERKVKLVEGQESQDESYVDDLQDLFEISTVTISPNNHSNKVFTQIGVNGKQLQLEVDTGSAVTVINEHSFNSTFENQNIEPSRTKLRAYSGEMIPVKGQITVNVSIGNGQFKDLKLVIVQGDGPSLIGRDWLQYMDPWKNFIGKIVEVNSLETELNSDQIAAQIKTEFPKLFENELGHLAGTQVSIDLKDNSKPVFCKSRPVPFALRERVEKEIDRLEAEGIIEKVKYSSWGTPVVPIVKPTGDIRLCGDYKVTINRFINTDVYPIPNMEELLANLNGGQEFTKLDLRQAYQQLELDEASRELTTISTIKGLYRYTRLPYGVSTAPSIFQRVMETTLKDIPGVFTYFDDILVTGKNRTVHLENLRLVLSRLAERGFRLQCAKCEFFLPQVEYLGVLIDKDGQHPTSEKIRAIRDAPTPKNITELRAYLGLLTHYAKFLPNLSTKLNPLYDLLKKEKEWQWTPTHEEAFNLSKHDLTSDSLLVHYDPDKEIVLACDASQYGIGAVLQHKINGQEKPIAYASRTLNHAERNYSQIEKEGLAIIFGVTKFRQYLLGRKFTLVTDHRPLLSLFSPSKSTPQMAASRIKRWSLILSTFQYDIQYRSSKANSNADGLSRLPLKEMSPEHNSENAELVLVLKTVNTDLPVTATDISVETRKDPVLRRVLLHVLEGWPNQIDQILDADIKPYFERRDELSAEQGCLLWGTRVIIPTCFRSTLLEELHSEHSGIVRMKSVARSIIWWPLMDSEIENVANACLDCQQLATKPPASKPTAWKWPLSPWKRLHIDFAGPFLDKYFFVVVDAHSKWIEVTTMQHITTTATIRHVRKLFSTFGLPEHIVSDNGSQFTSAEFQQFLRLNAIRHTLTAPGHPATNGQAERAVASFKVALKKMANQPGDVEDKLQRFLLSYRTTPHSTTGKTPSELLMKRRLRTRLSAVRPTIDSRMVVKEDPPLNEKPRTFNENQSVFVQNFSLRGPRWVQGTIIERHGARNYHVSVNGNIWKRHTDQIRVRHCDFQSEIQLSDPVPFDIPVPNVKRTDKHTMTSNIPPTLTRAPTERTIGDQSSERRYPQRDRRPPKRFE